MIKKQTYRQILSSFAALLLITSVLLVWAPQLVRAAVDTCTWTGGGVNSNFSTAANWTGCDNGSVPQNGDNLVFPAATIDTTMSNDILNSVGTITVQGGANPGNHYYAIQDTVSGSLTLTQAISVGDNQVFNFTHETIIGANLTVAVGDQSEVSFSGPSVTTGTYQLTFSWTDKDNITAATDKDTLPDLLLGSFTGSLVGSPGTSIRLEGVDAQWDWSGTGWPGAINAVDSIIRFDEDSNFGAATSGINLTRSQLESIGTAKTLAEPLTLTGNLFGRTKGGAQSLVGYETVASPIDGKLTMSGSVVLQADTAIDPYNYDIEFSGNLSGAYMLGTSQTYAVTATSGHMVITGVSNTSLIPNGNYAVPAAGPLTGSLPGEDVIVSEDGELAINGTRGSVLVLAGGVLKGNGTVGAVGIFDTARLASGSSPGCINTGSLDFAEGAYLDIELAGNTVCTQYDQVRVSGTVDVTDASLTITHLDDFIPADGSTFTLVSNDGSDQVAGTFVGLTNGATFTIDDVLYRINYDGGDGNDIVLTVQDAPGVPNTGYALPLSNPYVIGVTVLVTAGAAYYLTRRYTLGFLNKK